MFRSGLTSCDWRSPLQQWSFSVDISLPSNPTTIFFTDYITNGSFCLTLSDDKDHVTVLSCDGSRPPAQLWLVQQGKGPGMGHTVTSVASPGLCAGLDLDSNGNFLSSGLVLMSCDFFDSGLAVSWNIDPQSQPSEISSSFAKTSCISAIETANVTAFTYGTGSDSATFIVNRDANASAVVLLHSKHYPIAAATTLILDSSGDVLFDSSNVSSTPVQRAYVVPFPQRISVTLCTGTHQSSVPTCSRGSAGART